MSADLVVSFVVDAPAPYPYQAYLLVRSLMERGGVPPDRIVAHLVAGCDVSVDRLLRSLGVQTRRVEPFGHPWCNKLQQLASLADVAADRAADRVMLLDTDMLATGAVDLPRSHAILGKPVDQAVPPLRILRSLFAEAALPVAPAAADVDGQPTVWPNLNGGLLVIPTVHLGPLGAAWVRWARWCLERLARFETWPQHVDQVALALAIAETSLPVKPLPREWNVPTHLGPVALDAPPRFLHYHRSVDRNGLLRPTGTPAIDGAIVSLGPSIARWRREHPVDHLARAAIAAAHPTDEVQPPDPVPAAALRRAALVRDTAAMLRAQTIVDVDGRVADPPPPADLALCLDGLATTTDAAAYRRTVALALASGRLGTLIAGPEAPPADPDTSVRFHEPLSHTILGHGDVIAFPVGGSEEGAVHLVLPDPSTRHPRDARASTLRPVVGMAWADPLTMAECLVVSRRELGFFPDHAPRLLEYAWVLERVRRVDGRPLRLLDVGAGVNVLPVLLHDDGHHVTTVDAHPQERLVTDRETWTEWGFLDYAALRPGIRSVRAPYEAFETDAPFDAIWSVSVIEHLPADSRRAWLRRMAGQLTPGGTLLLTVDLVPFSDALWGWAEGRRVEREAIHGRLPDLHRELMAEGFVVESSEVIAWVPGSRVGVARVAATRASGSHAVPIATALGAGPAPRVTPSATRRERDAVTVLMPAYRSDHRLTDTLRSMAAQTHRHVVVRLSVDHAPGSELPPLPEMGHVGLEIHHQPDRLGWIGNVNWLLDTVDTPYFLLIPHDDQLTPPYLEAAVAQLEDEPGVVAAHGSLRYHGVRDGEEHHSASIHGERTERVRTFLERRPHLAGLFQRGVIRSEPIWDGVRHRIARADGHLANDLWSLELLLYGETRSIDGIWYDKYTDPGGLSRVFHARTMEEKSVMLADSLGGLMRLMEDHRFPDADRERLATDWAAWLLGLQGVWNVVEDVPDSNETPYREVRPALARFIARSLLAARPVEEQQDGRDP